MNLMKKDDLLLAESSSIFPDDFNLSYSNSLSVSLKSLQHSFICYLSFGPFKLSKNCLLQANSSYDLLRTIIPIRDDEHESLSPTVSPFVQGIISKLLNKNLLARPDAKTMLGEMTNYVGKNCHKNQICILGNGTKDLGQPNLMKKGNCLTKKAKRFKLN